MKDDLINIIVDYWGIFKLPDLVRLEYYKRHPKARIWYDITRINHPGAMLLVREYIAEHRESELNMCKIWWEHLSENNCPDAVQLCRENMARIWWRYMSENNCPEAVQLCRENSGKNLVEIYVGE